MRAVYKYPLDTNTDHMEVRAPANAELLHVAEQHGSLYVWARVDPSAPEVVYRLRVAGTGHPVEADGRYLGTVILRGGDLVWHFFYLSWYRE